MRNHSEWTGVRRDGHDLRVPGAQRFDVDHDRLALALDPDVGQDAPVTVTFLDVELKAHGAALHERLASVASRPPGAAPRMVRLQRVHADVPDGLLLAGHATDPDSIAINDTQHPRVRLRHCGAWRCWSRVTGEHRDVVEPDSARRSDALDPAQALQVSGLKPAAG